MPPKCYKCGEGTYGWDYGRSRSSHGDSFPMCKMCAQVYSKHWEYSKEEEYYKEDPVEKRNRAKEESGRKSRQKRRNDATVKSCSECGESQPHDPEDYICICCRDGEHALAGTYSNEPIITTDGPEYFESIA